MGVTYRVVGTHAVDGIRPGGTVTIDDAVRARQLQRGGHIRPAETKTPGPKRRAPGGKR